MSDCRAPRYGDGSVVTPRLRQSRAWEWNGGSGTQDRRRGPRALVWSQRRSTALVNSNSQKRSQRERACRRMNSFESRCRIGVRRVERNQKGGVEISGQFRSSRSARMRCAPLAASFFLPKTFARRAANGGVGGAVVGRSGTRRAITRLCLVIWISSPSLK